MINYFGICVDSSPLLPWLSIVFYNEEYVKMNAFFVRLKSYIYTDNIHKRRVHSVISYFSGAALVPIIILHFCSTTGL